MKLNVIKFNCVKSTNESAIKIIRSRKKKEGIIISNLQTNGKGTMGKKWVSQKGNLFISVFFELKETLPNFKEFSLINPIIIKKVLSTYSINAVKIKRPNDLLIKSKKVCGILQEVIRFEKKNFLIIGIGINTLTYPMNNRFKSTSLLECSNKLINNSEIIKKLKNSYESIFYNYKINKLLLKKI
tara:strand:+ start:588 stop:1142 length:555 start_codon:yes stop_codon:yes gene_type:complete